MPALESDLHQLCRACGLCCDGSLFGFFDMQIEERGLPLRLGTPPDRPDALVFLQPCSALVNGSCSCYEQRPQVCRRYDCKTLRAFKAGELPQDRAMEQVQSIRQRCSEVRQLLLEAFPPVERDSLHELDITSLQARLRELPGKTTEQGRALLEYVMLTKHLDLHFRDEAGLKFT